MAVKGVDLSEMNGAVDFQALKNAGVQFVILRCGYGSDFSHQDDKRFGENVAKAQAAGLPWGCYLYSYATDRDMARSEAAHTLRLLGGRKPPYGVWYDVEDPSQAGADLVGICEAYCGAVEAAGLYVGIYSMVSWLNGKLNSSRLDRYDKWVAQWNSTCDYQKPYGIWQFTDRWSIGGKLFDGNYAYKDYPALTGGAEQEEAMTEETVRALAREEIAGYFAGLAREETSDWAKEDVGRAQERGLLLGDSGGSFRPHSYLTREEAAALANRIVARKE